MDDLFYAIYQVIFFRCAFAYLVIKPRRHRGIDATPNEFFENIAKTRRPI